jgi:hypothetical protein
MSRPNNKRSRPIPCDYQKTIADVTLLGKYEEARCQYNHKKITGSNLTIVNSIKPRSGLYLFWINVSTITI